MPRPPPPAVVRGMPRFAIRIGLRALVVTIVSTAAAFVVAMVLAFTLPVATVWWTGYAILLGIVLFELVFIAWVTTSVYRIRRRLTANAPDVCFNCAYPLAPDPANPAPPICPECGHLNNLQDLNKGWKRNLRLPE